MPSIKDFEKKKKHKEQNQKKSETTHMKANEEAKMETPKRRPSKEDKVESMAAQELRSDEAVMDTDSINDSLNEGPPPKTQDSTQSSSERDTSATTEETTSSSQSAEAPEEESTSESHKIHIEFPGSFILRSKFSRTFETMDKVATDWMNDGDFEGLPVGHPLLQILAAKSLKKAKGIEKKAQNTQVYALAKIGLEYAKSKLKK